MTKNYSCVAGSNSFLVDQSHNIILHSPFEPAAQWYDYVAINNDAKFVQAIGQMSGVVMRGGI